MKTLDRGGKKRGNDISMVDSSLFQTAAPFAPFAPLTRGLQI